MFPFRVLTAAPLLLAGLLAAPLTARAAESYDNCTGFIDSVPATLTTQGVWCLRHDLSTAVTSGVAITIATNNVTIDCNGFKLGGLAGGTGTSVTGIYAASRANASVRHCNIRGFNTGVRFSGASGGGHFVEDNRFDGNTLYGIDVEGEGSVVRHNQVRDTGGSTNVLGGAYAIFVLTGVDVIDNTVIGVAPTANGSGNANATGIYTYDNSTGSVIGNRVRGLVSLGVEKAYGVYNYASGRTILRDNNLVDGGNAGSVGLQCDSNLATAKDNVVSGFAFSINSCGDDGGNVLK